MEKRPDSGADIVIDLKAEGHTVVWPSAAS